MNAHINFIHHNLITSLMRHTTLCAFFAEEILTELKHNTKVKFKETDLFRVYQSIDLVSSCAAMMYVWCILLICAARFFI